MSTVLINVTYQGQSGSYYAHIDPGVDDATIRRVSEESARAGEIVGITKRVPRNAFTNFVIDRFHGDGQPRFIVRPKVPFG